jgi:polyhydroxybutyrate depolymerase
MRANRRTHALEFRTTVKVALALAIFALAGCVGGGTATEAPVPTDAFDVVDIAPADSRRPDPPDSFTDTGLVGQRPYRFRVPRIYDRARPAPLVILLHGYGVSGWAQDLYFGFGQLAERRGFLYAYPDGVRDAKGLRFWNAFPSLAAAGVSLPDDVGYITAIIDDMSVRFNVDAHRVYLVGHSNGAFMAYRYACERPTRIAAIAGLAGAMLTDASACSPSARVAILHIHGDADARISYSGGTIRGVPYLGAVDSVARWAGINGCGSFEPTETILDLESSLPGAETSVSRHNACAGGAAELWTIHGAGHLPVLGPEWATTVYGWLMAHTRP